MCVLGTMPLPNQASLALFCIASHTCTHMHTLANTQPGRDEDEDRPSRSASPVDLQQRPKESLLLAAVRMRKDQPEATEEQKQLDEEADILKHVLQKQALKAVKELAQV